MKDFKTYFKLILSDLKVELSDEFDKNFERKAFFTEKWPQTKWPVNKGSLMLPFPQCPFQRPSHRERDVAAKEIVLNSCWLSGDEAIKKTTACSEE